MRYQKETKTSLFTRLIDFGFCTFLLITESTIDSF